MFYPIFKTPPPPVAKKTPAKGSFSEAGWVAWGGACTGLCARVSQMRLVQMVKVWQEWQQMEDEEDPPVCGGCRRLCVPVSEQPPPPPRADPRSQPCRSMGPQPYTAVQSGPLSPCVCVPGGGGVRDRRNMQNSAQQKCAKLCCGI